MTAVRYGAKTVQRSRELEVTAAEIWSTAVTAIWETDPEAIAAVLPEPLSPAERPLVRLTITSVQMPGYPTFGAAWFGVAAKHGDSSLEAKIMRVVALCADVPGLALSARNLAVVLHPAMSADPIEVDVRAALDHLVAEDRVRETDDGYRLQSPEQKDWEKTRRGIDMKPGDAVRLRKRILKDALGSLTVTKGRTFKVELHVEREKMSDGDITLDLRDE